MAKLNWQRLFQEINQVMGPDQENPELPDEKLQDIIAVDQAKQEWINAKRFFEEVTEPDLVDHAIYQMEAAERRYMHLLKTARCKAKKIIE